MKLLGGEREIETRKKAKREKGTKIMTICNMDISCNSIYSQNQGTVPQ